LKNARYYLEQEERIQNIAKMSAMAIPLRFALGKNHPDANKYCVITNWWRERNRQGIYGYPTLDLTGMRIASSNQLLSALTAGLSLCSTSVSEPKSSALKIEAFLSKCDAMTISDLKRILLEKPLEKVSEAQQQPAEHQVGL
jgi:hypothetical protein